jgi:hypothetical protein
MWLLKLLFALGGAWNTFFAVLALTRGYDTYLFAHRLDRRRDPIAFWFYSIFCRGVSGILLLGGALFFL